MISEAIHTKRLSRKPAARVAAPASLHTFDKSEASKKRAEALANLQFNVDSLASLTKELRDLMWANLAVYGVGPLEMEFTSTYSPYSSPTRGPFGSVLVIVKARWSALGQTQLRLRDLLDGVFSVRFSYDDDGRPLREKKDGQLVSFSLAIQAEGEFRFYGLKAVVEQERATYSALGNLRQAQEIAGVERAPRGGLDYAVLETEKALQDEIAALEQQLEERKKALEKQTAEADTVRKKLRNADAPATQTLAAQLAVLHEKLGIKPF